MRHTMIVAVDAKGNRKEIHGPEAPDKEKRAYFNGVKLGELPKGVVRIEEWERTRQTTGIDHAAKKRRLDEEAKARKEAKAEEKPEAESQGKGEGKPEGEGAKE